MASSSPTLVHSNVINPQQHGAQVTIAAAYGLTAFWFCLGLRCYVRWPLTQMFRWDDAVITAATAVASIQVSIVLAAVNQGLGSVPTMLSPDSPETVEKMMYAGNLFWVLASSMSRLSVALFLRRLSNLGLHIRINIALWTCCAVFGALSFLLIAINSPYSRPWSVVTETGQLSVVHWIITEILLSILDLATVATAIHIVWHLQMTRQKKTRVVLLFALRLPLLVIAALHMASLSHTFQNAQDYPVNAVKPEIYGQVELAWCLISATLPCLANFFRDTQTTLPGGGGAWSSVDGTNMTATTGSKHERMAKREWELSVLRPGQSSARTMRSIAADETSTKSDNSQREILWNGSQDQREAYSFRPVKLINGVAFCLGVAFTTLLSLHVIDVPVLVTIGEMMIETILRPPKPLSTKN